MTKEPTPRFDPRFDPAFQPGYVPAAGESVAGAPAEPDGASGTANAGRYPKRHARGAAGSAGTPRVSLSTGDASSPTGADTSPVRSRPRYADASSVPQSFGQSPSGSRPQLPSPPPTPALPLADSFDQGPSDAHSDVPSDTGTFAASAAQQLVRNPFLVTLSALAVIFVAVGAWLFNRSYEAYNDAGNFASQGDFVAVESAINVAPLFVLFGAAIAVGVLFVMAVRWRRD